MSETHAHEMRLDLEWRADTAAAVFPTMHATLMVYPLSHEETQLDLRGTYDPPGGLFGDLAAARILRAGAIRARNVGFIRQLEADAAGRGLALTKHVMNLPKRILVAIDLGATSDAALAYDEVGEDLIVTGTHGRSGVLRALLGSVAEKIIRTATRPVLTIHGPGRESAPSVSP